jgi:LPXTG-motif cell wall-anchored protein
VPLSRCRRSGATSFAAVLAVVGVAAFVSIPSAGATAPAAVGAANATSVAKLKVFKPGVSVRRKDKTTFKAATDGKKLHVGDTVQTDATGFAEIDYTDESFTRLDVNTTFTIVSLTDDQGNRKIDGSLDVGRTWNRTSALTESESFEQNGAGAIAAVVGSAFQFECDGMGHCTVMSVVDGIRYTTVDGEIKILPPLEQCAATEVSPSDTNLCSAFTKVTPDMLDAFAALNLVLDAQRGFPGPTFGVVQNGVVQVQDAPATIDYCEENNLPPECVDPTPPGTGTDVDASTASVAGSSVTQQALPFTGSNHTSLVVGIGAILLLVGTALLIAARRRRSAIEIDT